MRKLSFIITIIIFSQFSQAKLLGQDNKGIIQGYVIELKSDTRLQGANIEVKNTLFRASSDSNGAYQIDGLEKGFYSLECSLMGYKSIIINDILVKKYQQLKIVFVLTPITLDKEVIVVNFDRPKKIPNENKNNIDPDFIINYDKSIDPDIIIAVDPSIDPDIIFNPINSELISKLFNDTLIVRILDSIIDKSNK